MPSTSHARALSLVLTLCACGDGGDEGDEHSLSSDTTCGLILQTRGALELDVRPQIALPTCLTQTSFESGVDVGYLFVEGELSSAELVIEDVRVGETGAGFSASLELTAREGGGWESTTCTADISSHDHVGPVELNRESYRMQGTLRCPALRDPLGEAEQVELVTMEFVATVAWD